MKLLLQYPQRSEFWAVLLLVSMHMAGFVGLQWAATRSYFEFLVPFNLLASTFLLIAFQPGKNMAFYLFFTLTALLGFAIEWVGVHTGVPFGAYSYDEVLGYKLAGVPLLIGLNWACLLLVSGSIAERTNLPGVVKLLLGASLMLALDFFIEPVAIRHHFWHWHTSSIPWQNYLAWFIISFLLLIPYRSLNFSKGHPLAIPYYLIQLLFFMAHNVTYLKN